MDKERNNIYIGFRTEHDKLLERLVWTCKSIYKMFQCLQPYVDVEEALQDMVVSFMEQCREGVRDVWVPNGKTSMDHQQHF